MFKKVLSWLAGLIVLASPFVLAWQRQNLIDWWRLRGYQPSTQISSLADHTTMNDYGRKLFYVHSPELKDKTSFGISCPIELEKTIVLGCYVDRRDIYIFDVVDKRLEGIEEVTAAHEMLHAAYDRLTSSERERIDRLTQSAFSQITNERIKNTVESYRQRDPSIVPNELHSILGTEVRDLPTELEDYYKRYFNDRKKIITFSEAYEAEFTSRQTQVAAYDAQLTQLKLQIDGLEQDLRIQQGFLETEKQKLDNLRASNPEAYNQAVPAYNQAVNSYNSSLTQIRGLADQYNEIVAKRNQLANEERELIDAIDSSLPTL